MNTRWALSASCLVLLAAVPAVAAPPACTEGVFVVEGAGGNPETVTIKDGTLTLSRGCSGGPLEFRTTTAGTVVRSGWLECDNERRVRARLRIDANCQNMIGGVTGVRSRSRRLFRAARCDDPQVCMERCSTDDDCPTGAFCGRRPGQCAGEGSCRPRPQACLHLFNPVCGCDGETHSNACAAAAAGTNVAHTGSCEGMCGTLLGIPCPKGEFCEYPPDTCNWADHAGRCLPLPDACTADYDPVCGCDGTTYSNECERQRAQVILAHRGACE